MSTGSDQEFERYERDPKRLEPGSSAKRLNRASGRLGGAVPVRFTEMTIETVKKLAEEDGTTVSKWIRTAVDDAVDRRCGAPGGAPATPYGVAITGFTVSEAMTINKSFARRG